MHPNSFNGQKNANGVNQAQGSTSIPASSAPIAPPLPDSNLVAPFGSIDESDVGLSTFTQFLFDDTIPFDENAFSFNDITNCNQTSTSSDDNVLLGVNAFQSSNVFQDAFSPWLEDAAFGDYLMSGGVGSHEVVPTYGGFAPYSGPASYSEVTSQGSITIPELDIHSSVESPSFEDSLTPLSGFFRTENLTHLPSSPPSFFDHPANLSCLPKG